MVQLFMQKYIIPLLLVALMTASFIRNAAWQNDETLWLDVALHAPNKYRGYNEIGLFYIDHREFQKAFEPLLLSLRLNPYQSTIYINLGLAYEGLGLPDKAMDIYQRAISMNPSDPTAYYNLGILYDDSKHDLARALELLLQARDRNPTEPDVHTRLAKIYREMGQEDMAQYEFKLYTELK
jgi:tetratricopeptide (TPR) repeat protein